MPKTSRVRFKIGSMDKVLILGHPHTGKTTLSTTLTRPVLHLDGYILRYESDRTAAEQAVKYLDSQEKWVAEGCLGYRMLGRGLEPYLVVMCVKQWEHGPWDKLVPGQRTMFARYLASNPAAEMVEYCG